MSKIELRNISKSFGSTEVIHDVSLSIEDGEFAVFVGPSGCGKSTLLRIIAGLEDVTSGEVQVGGKDVTHVEPAKRGLAMVFQSYALYPHMTVAQNLSFGLRVARRPKPEIAERVGRAADILQLTELLKRRPAQLSGGQRQRVAIGRAIVRDPKVFLFDEPLSNLDAELRVQTRVEIAKLHSMLGNTMVYVTHDQTEALTLADKIVVLRAGRVEQIGVPLALYNEPDNAFVAGFIGSPRMNFLDATALGGRLFSVCGVKVEVPITSTVNAGEKVRFGIRPEHLEAARGVTLPVTIDVVEQLGSTSYLYGKLSSGETIIAEKRLSQTSTKGQATVKFNPADIRLFDSKEKRIR
ncbi:MAG: sn-glycerol-3-phosphate ABC transporter ATP-binding protein UgpC [Pseudomonadota bacterium]|nr:sn-glycerol-3-phosphate ABC transporter ATP-binding protein UgpC [Pseudomonadota bacterium]